MPYQAIADRLDVNLNTVKSRVFRARARALAGEITGVGHTDFKGEDAYNVDLSVRRVQTVQTFLTKRLPSP